MAINPSQLTGKTSIGPGTKIKAQGPTIPTMSTSVKSVFPVQPTPAKMRKGR